MNIDWSKAPEGATHKNISTEDGFWYRFDFEKNLAAYCPVGRTEWVPSGRADQYNDGSMEDMAARCSSSTGDHVTYDQREKQADSLYLTMRPNDTLHECEPGNPKWKACLKAIDAGYRKFEIVEDDV